MEKFSYFSNVLKRPFETLEELEKEEFAYLEQQEEKEKQLEEKRRRAEEVSNAYQKIRDAEKEYIDLKNQFVKDYGVYYQSYREQGIPPVDFLSDIRSMFPRMFGNFPR